MDRIRIILLREKIENLKRTVELRKQIVAQLNDRLALERALSAIAL
jgi:hypothetical protein